jgi:hypothetical protein
MHFDFLLNLVILPDEFLDGVLLEHVEHVPLGVKIGRVHVHLCSDSELFNIMLSDTPTIYSFKTTAQNSNLFKQKVIHHPSKQAK